MINLRWRHISILLLTSCLAACATATQSPAPRREMGDMPNRVLAEACNLPPDANRAHYLIGSGSLMRDESRKRASPWADDYLYPRRPVIYQPKARQVDELVYQRLREYVSRKKMESGG